MLVTNQRLDKLAAARCDFKERGMLEESCIEQAYDAFIRDLGTPARLKFYHLCSNIPH